MNSDIVLPPEIASLVAERSRIWARYDAAQQDYETINKLGAEVGSSGNTAVVERLTVDGVAPEEIVAAIQAFRVEKAEVAKLQREISNKAAEIESIRSHVTNMYIVYGVSAAIVIGLLSLWIMSMR